MALLSVLTFVCIRLGLSSGLLAVAPVIVPNPSHTPYVLELRREVLPVRRKGKVVSQKTSYSGLISVGQPAQEFRVIFDTGSGHVVIPSAECKSESCLIHNRYNVSASRSGVAINAQGKPLAEGDLADQVTIGYGTGQILGELVKESVCIGAASPPDALVDDQPHQVCEPTNVVMAVEMSKQPFKSFTFDGIVGLGLTSLCLGNKFSFFDNFANAQNGYSPHFSVSLTDERDGDSSEIAFGGLNPTKLLGPVSWTPVVNPDLGHWQVELLAVRVDGQPLSICQEGGCRAVIDTGTSHLGIPAPHDKGLQDLLLQPANDLDDCRRVQGPVLEFEFPGFTMTLHPEDYMRPMPLEEGIQVGSVKGVTMDKDDAVPLPSVEVVENAIPNMQCRARLMPVNLPAPLGPNLFILGEPALHRYYTIFDWKGAQTGPQIGFGLSNKVRYSDPAKMAEYGQVLREDVKAVLPSPQATTQSSLAVSLNVGLNDEIILVQIQVKVSHRCRRS